MNTSERLIVLATVVGAVLSCTQTWSAEFVSVGQFPEGDFGTSVIAVASTELSVTGGGLRYARQSFLDQDAYIWDQLNGLRSLENEFVPIDPPQLPHSVTMSTGISADGSVVSANSFFLGSSFAFTAATWSEVSGLSLLPDIPTGIGDYRSQGVSPDGSTVVGYSDTSAGREAVVWRAGEAPFSLGDLSGGPISSGATAASYDGSVIVGQASSESGGEAFRWTEADGLVGLGDLPGGIYGTSAKDVSADGKIIVGSGFSEASDRSIEAFRWTQEGGFEPLGSTAPGVFRSTATAISGNGRVIVGSNGSLENQAAFIWTRASGMLDLETVLVAQGLSSEIAGWRIITADDVSHDGSVIIGNGINPRGVREGWIVQIDLSLIPEPSTAALLIAASASLFATRRSRRSGQ